MNYIDLWKSINEKIIKSIENDDIQKLEFLMNERQEIIDNVNIEDFKEELGEDLYVDEQIKNLLSDKMKETKKEIEEYSKTKNANNAYVRNSNQKLHLFNEKI